MKTVEMNKIFQEKDKAKYERITVEEHFSTPEHLDQLRAILDKNILFALDYPMEDPAEGVKFMDSAPIDPDDRKKIYHLNAERVFLL